VLNNLPLVLQGLELYFIAHFSFLDDDVAGLSTSPLHELSDPFFGTLASDQNACLEATRPPSSFSDIFIHVHRRTCRGQYLADYTVTRAHAVYLALFSQWDGTGGLLSGPM